VLSPTPLPVAGTLPPWLTGTLLRNGPGTFTIPRSGGRDDLRFTHWFDGLGILHRFRVDGAGGSVAYSARKTAAEEEARLAGGAPLGATFGQDPCGGVFARVRSAWAGIINDRTNVNVSVGTFGRPAGGGGATATATAPTAAAAAAPVYARTDGNVLLQVDPDTLAVTDRTSYQAANGALKGPLSSAHPETCPTTGDVYNFTQDFGAAGATYHVFCVPADGGLPAAYEVGRFSGPPSYIHSFFLTSRYVVLAAWPAVLRPLRLLWSGNVTDAIDFEAGQPTTFHVLDRRRPAPGGAAPPPPVATYTGPAQFCFHTVNAHDTAAGDVSLTLCYYPDTAIIKDFALGKLASAPARDFHKPRLVTYTLPDPAAAVAAAAAAAEKAGGRKQAQTPRVPAVGPVFGSEQQLELPRINPAYATRPHTHTYGVSYTAADADRSNFYWNALAKVSAPPGDAAPPPAVVEWSEAGCYPSEPVFVGRPGATAEDDGAVLSVVVDVARRRTFLLVLDAESFTEVARAEVDAVVPLTFHGTFLREEQAAATA